MKIGENIQDSFTFTHEALFGKWVRWIMLAISSLIFPIMYGYTVKIMRGVQPSYEEESFFTLFIDGIKLLVINIVYMIIPLIACAATVGYAVFGIISAGKNFSLDTLLSMAGGLITGLVLTIILAIIFTLLNVIASVRFARTGSIGEAFAIGEIISTIKKIGWVNYIFSLIVLFIVVAVIVIVLTCVEMALNVIPLIGIILGWIISLFTGPYLSILTTRYYSLLYDEGV
ncbi:MAG: DUF4013 domain-containing protein [Methanospirillum sp.]|uniref:DUF4013 domain-containing protein n=1 Tax=Methanospirillum sp. TaxID=45200 RepID=UPI00236E4381|nr:DUF4013 domain-containing protein [Methanospirillum sp.]MDD1729211.1 DUF4013 domain-containing protein [Methanospirillum sp.]